MTETGKERRRISRRAALAGTMLALGVAAIRPAAAQEKVSRAIAEYRAAPNGDQRCAACSNFLPPNGCKFVEGDVSQNGWCQLFTPKT
jgi:hypothetical protein